MKIYLRDFVIKGKRQLKYLLDNLYIYLKIKSNKSLISKINCNYYSYLYSCQQLFPFQFFP